MISVQKKTLQQGFTLIELLVVIGILGVLATVLLVAINPLEQLARTRDAGRTSMMTQLGRGTANYAATQGGTGYVTAATTVMTTLKTANEISQYLYAPPSSNASVAACAPTAANAFAEVDGAAAATNICYFSPANQSDAIWWTAAESQTYISRGGCAGGTPYPVIAYIVSQGKAGVDCLVDKTKAPLVGDTLK